MTQTESVPNIHDHSAYLDVVSRANAEFGTHGWTYKVLERPTLVGHEFGNREKFRAYLARVEVAVVAKPSRLLNRRVTYKPDTKGLRNSIVWVRRVDMGVAFMSAKNPLPQNYRETMEAAVENAVVKLLEGLMMGANGDDGPVEPDGDDGDRGVELADALPPSMRITSRRKER